MPGFKIHISVSTACGVAYGVAGYQVGAPIPHCLLAGTLCSVGGILPDLDSGSGKPVKEIFGFVAAVVPIMLIHRISNMELPHEVIVISGIGAYMAVRFGLASAFSRLTVHRGMWHSLPAAAIAGVATFLLCKCNELDLRVYRSLAVVCGFLSHLVMDEIWSVELRHGLPRLKKSFGTALKLWSPKYKLSTALTYGVFVCLLGLANGDSAVIVNGRPRVASFFESADDEFEQQELNLVR